MYPACGGKWGIVREAVFAAEKCDRPVLVKIYACFTPAQFYPILLSCVLNKNRAQFHAIFILRA